MLPSTILNLFRWAPTPQCPEIILETVFCPSSIRETLGKMECENLPVSVAS
jgi:hypothetical protein